MTSSQTGDALGRRAEERREQSVLVESADEDADRVAASPLKVRIIEFLVLSAGVIIVLTLLGAPPLLILEVFSLAAILGLSALAIVILLGGRTRIRWQGRGRR